jgi:hypothetical protein
MSEGDIAAIQCADYTLGKRQNRKVADLVSGFGGDGTGGGADGEPLGGAGDAAQMLPPRAMRRASSRSWGGRG